MRKYTFTNHSQLSCLGCVQRCARNKTAKINKEFCLLLGRLIPEGGRRHAVNAYFLENTFAYSRNTHTGGIKEKKKKQVLASRTVVQDLDGVETFRCPVLFCAMVS